MTSDLMLEPYATRLQFSVDNQLESNHWVQIIRRFLEQIAMDFIESRPCLIGHIKGFVDCSDFGYLTFSLVDAKRPANFTGELTRPTRILMMDLNVHVYGIGINVIKAIIQKNGIQFSVPDKVWNIEIKNLTN